MNIDDHWQFVTVCYMASVYLRKGSKHYMARFRSADGTWLARSTKETNRAKALRLAFELESAGAALSTDDPTAAQVDRIVRDLWQRHTGKRIGLNRTDEFLRSWVRSLKRKPGTIERYTQITDEFIALLGERAAMDLKAITTADVQAFVDRDGTLGRSGTTVVLNAKILRAAFNHAIRLCFIERNPALGAQLPDAIAEKRKAFTDAEVELLLAHTKGTDWCTAIMLGTYAGLRLGDAANLKWESVDLSEGMLRFVPEKTSRKGKELKVPMSDRLLDYLEKLAGTPSAQHSKFVCPKLAGIAIGGRAGLSSAFVNLMKTADVEAEHATAKDGRTRKFSRKTFHSLRHTFFTRMANNDIPPDHRAAVGGHANSKETSRYSHLSEAVLRKAVNAGI